MLILCLSAPAAWAQSIPAKGADATLDVATWNIEWFGAANGPSDDDQQIANVEAVLRESDIDLWALQEISDEAAFATLLNGLGENYSGTLASISGQQRIGFLWRTDVLSRVVVRHILTDFMDPFAQRPPLQLEADVTLPDGTQRLTFITVHMKAPTSPQQESYERRVEAAAQLKNYLDFLLPNSPVIVLGDFNDELGQSVYQSQPSPYAPFLADPDDYFFTTLPLDQGNVATYCGSSSTCGSGSTLDHILVTDELIPSYVTADRYAELLTSIGSYVFTTSDHLPVFAQFIFVDRTATDEPTLPQTLAVQPAYPNPFTTATTVSFTLPRPGPVQVDVYDLLGRYVTTLLDASRPAGEHRVRFDAGNEPPGLYLVRVTAEGVTHTQRVVRLR